MNLKNMTYCSLKQVLPVAQSLEPLTNVLGLILFGDSDFSLPCEQAEYNFFRNIEVLVAISSFDKESS